MRLTIGISPCPNDTYIFEAIHQSNIDTDGIDFAFVFEDVETLNEMASAQKLDIVKISYAHYFSVCENYIMCRSGGAMGFGVGPLLISAGNPDHFDAATASIAIPGLHTTANFLLQYAFPQAANKKPMRFDRIENALLSGEEEAGVIIHENRFTYAAKGLQKIMDLGEYWEESTGLPIPLGGIAVRRNLQIDVQQRIDKLIRESLLYARRRQEKLSAFIRKNAQEMNDDVMKNHIDLYVNDFSLDAGKKGEKALHKMMEILHVSTTQSIFIQHK